MTEEIENDSAESSKEKVEREGLEKHFYRFKEINHRLRSTGALLVMLTITNIALLLMGISSFFSLLSKPFLVCSFGIAIFCAGAAYVFDILRRDGNILFEIISNELHSVEAEPFLDEPVETVNVEDDIKIDRIDALVELRQFTQNSDMPLLPGKFGPAILLLVNLLISIAFAFLLRGFFRI